MVNPQSTLRGQARLVRRSLRRLVQQVRYRQIGLQGVPVLFANSFPKSGTHLLTQVLQGFPRLGPAVDSGLPAVVMYAGDTGRPRPVEEILGDLRRLLPGDIAYGHVHALPQTVGFLSQPGYCPYFILRDPRDVVVSHVHYVTEMEPNHIHHRYFAEELHSFDERLRASILGRPDPAVPFPDVRARFVPFLGWLQRPDVLTLRYEEFIAEGEATLGRVLDHAAESGFPIKVNRAEAISILEAGINPQRSPTFRSGKIGGWRKSFSEENKRVFKEVAGELLVQLGYEQDENW